MSDVVNYGDLEKRLEPIIKVANDIGFGSEIDRDELADIVNKFDIKEKDYEKVVRTIVYIRERFIHKKSRYEAFKIAFPNRVDKRMSRATIETKAKRVENYKIYKYLVTILTTSTYVLYAFDRMRVLDLTLQKIFDDKIKERDRVEYIKTFLAETKKSDDDKKFEVNIDLQQNNVSISAIEEKLSKISEKLDGLSAREILKVSDGS